MSNLSCAGYDNEWQFPAITEKYSYQIMSTKSMSTDDVIYFGFPWATLIDTLDRKGLQGAFELLSRLEEYKTLLENYSHVITVCQHIRMLEHIDLFNKAGVNHIFWSHAVKGMKHPPSNYNINIYPFPLYPVQTTDANINITKREYLYSFVGAKSNKCYLTQSRNIIIDLLGDDQRGLIVSRDAWHFNRIVYDHQINKQSDNQSDWVNKSASKEFKRILQQSVFSLCPGGSGPNSIRLWESIGFGAIPIILSDTYLPPGNRKLWEEAVVFCKEEPEAISELPDMLAEIAKDGALIKKKRHALRQLWMLYGPDCFTYDVEKLFLDLANGDAYAKIGKPTIPYAPLLTMAQKQWKENSGSSDWIGPFLLGCSVRAIASPRYFSKQYRDDPVFQQAYCHAMKHGDPKYHKIMSKVIRSKHINIG